MSPTSKELRERSLTLVILISLMLVVAQLTITCNTGSERDSSDLQNKVILTSIARRFRDLSASFGGQNNPDHWIWNLTYYDPYITQELFEKYHILLTWDMNKSRFEALHGRSHENLNIYERKDLETVEAIVSDCNEWMKQKGRLACEFDGGNDYRAYPYTTFLLYTSYLTYQSEKLGFLDGRYLLVNSDKPTTQLSPDFMLSRNAMARMVSYNLLLRASLLLVQEYEGRGIQLPRDAWGWERPSYAVRQSYYLEKRAEWEKFLGEALHIRIDWTEVGFEAKNPETGEKVSFPRDDDLLNEALKELNFYKEKCDFVNYFQIENYPMFLLSILRLYDVNLELDKATNKYVLAPGPTDPEKFFNIVAEFTFVNDQSDIEYLRKNLKSW